MRNAYAVLGVAFAIVFGAAYTAFSPPAEPPSTTGPTESITPPNELTMNLTLTSTAFADGEFIPSVYTCDGDNTNPPLTIGGVPTEAQALVLVMDDPDIPAEIKAARGIEKFDHWVLYNLPADTTEIPNGATVGSTGNNTRGEAVYTGPCPPPEYEPTTHRYIFRLYALPAPLNFVTTPTLDEVEAAAQGAAIATAELVGRYTRVTK